MPDPTPIDLLAGFPGWVTEFDLQFRQEASRSASGVTVVKDLGPPLWVMAAQSRTLRPNLLDEWRARLQAMENGLNRFRGYAFSRCYPVRYPKGSWPAGGGFDGTNGALADIDEDDRGVIDVEDFPAGYAFSIGDMIQVGDTDLHRVMAAGVTGGGGDVAGLKVHPPLWFGVEAGAALSVVKPSSIMSIVPGSISTQADLTGRGSVTFRAQEVR